jgi:hypothetical protein
MDILTVEALRDSGILQETNRLWFHPLGLALAVEHPSGNIVIVDRREYPQGIVFDEAVISRPVADLFRAFRFKRHRARQRALGFVLQPVPKDDKE